MALVDKLLLFVQEGIAFSSIRSYGHLKGIDVQKEAKLKFVVQYDLSILIYLINDTSSKEE